MKLRLFLLIIVLFSGCHSKSDKVAEKLADTLAKLRVKADFRPLDSAEAYAFINKYYLPGLDTTPLGRKIYINPLTGWDFQELFKMDSAQLVKEAETKKRDVRFYPPEPISFDRKYVWNSKKLVKTIMIVDSIKFDHHRIETINAWHKKFGNGYMCISYPQYNSHTKKLLIREWIENGDWCGTGREREFWYTKTADGWKNY